MNQRWKRVIPTTSKGLSECPFGYIAKEEAILCKRLEQYDYDIHSLLWYEEEKQKTVSEPTTNVVNAINTTAERSFDKLNSDLTSYNNAINSDSHKQLSSQQKSCHNIPYIENVTDLKDEKTLEQITEMISIIKTMKLILKTMKIILIIRI